jgi:hypothetical protein
MLAKAEALLSKSAVFISFGAMVAIVVTLCNRNDETKALAKCDSTVNWLSAAFWMPGRSARGI